MGQAARVDEQPRLRVQHSKQTYVTMEWLARRACTYASAPRAARTST